MFERLTPRCWILQKKSFINKVKYALKYCGGCNPRYDRIKAVKQLEEELGEQLSVVEQEIYYDEVFVICGCTASCTDLSLVNAKKITFINFAKVF